MLNHEGDMNLKNLQNLAEKQWGTDFSIIKIDVPNAPFDIFKIWALIYNQFEVLLEYETGTFAISVKMDSGFVFLDKLTTEKIIYGFKSVSSENISRNYGILDEVLKRLIQNIKA